MDYYPTDTVQEQFTAQPNTAAPIVAINHGGEVNQYQWVSPRNIAIALGGVVMLTIGAIAMRSTAITDQPIKIAPLAQPVIKNEQINKEILEGSLEDLNKLIFLTDTRIEKDKLALKNERAKEITTWANKLVSDKNADKDSSCYKSIYGRKCYLTKFINEQAERYKDSYRARQWKKANEALFELDSARVAWIGYVDLPLQGDATAGAIQNELTKRVDIEKQSDNAIAAELYGGK